MEKVKKEKHKMKIKKILFLMGVVVFLSANGYCSLQYEKELAQKFCPSLQLHSGDQGVAPKPVEIMSNGRAERPVTIAGIQELGPIFKPNLLGMGKEMSSNTTLYSESFGYAQSKEKTRKGRITGTIVGAGIGGGLGYLFYSAIAESQEGELEKVDKPSPLFIIVPAVVGGLSGYAIGTYHDGITRKEKFGFEYPKKTSKKGRIIGTTVGVGIGGCLVYMLSVAAALGDSEPSPLVIIVPPAIGGIFGYIIGKGYDIGDYYDEK
ncbi:hypothetical protein KKH56_07490 [bacterium]|nr:hypothetical protein [bacterium]